MRSALIEKLGRLLDEPPSNERDVTYALVEIRKILERDGTKKTHWTLGFYCDWALHTQLTGRDAKRILNMLDERLGRFDPKYPESIDPDGAVHEVLSFSLLRKHLQDFCGRDELPTVWTDDMFAWLKFAQIYGEIVRDTPLLNLAKTHNFRYLRELVIVACEPSEEIVMADPKERHFGFKWKFTSNRGESSLMPFTSNLPDPPAGWPIQGTRK